MPSPIASTSWFPARPFVRWLYSNNPFYILGTALVFAGLQTTFDTSRIGFKVELLSLALLAFTSVLAATAFALIRYGQVWDDVRSLLLLVVVMCLSVSCTLDEAISTAFWRGTAYAGIGLAYSVAVSLALLYGLRIRLRLGYLLPYLLLLSLFFGWPVLLGWLVQTVSTSAALWGILAFPCAIAAVALLLYPALSAGADYVDSNGTPWRWPWYPWPLFFVIGCIALLRTFWLCESFDVRGGSPNLFAPYLLVPILLAAGALALDGAIRARHAGWQRAILLALAVSWGLCLVQPNNSAHASFVDQMRTTLGVSPTWPLLVALTGIYITAVLRKAAGATWALSASLAAFSVVGVDTYDTLRSPQGVPWLAVAAVQAAIAWRSGHSRPCFLAAASVVAAFAIDLRETAFFWRQGFIPWNLLLLSAMVIGYYYRDRTAIVLRWLSAAAWPGLTLLAVSTPTVPQLLFEQWTNELVAQLYPLALAAIGMTYAWIVREKILAYAVLAAFGLWCRDVGWRDFLWLRQHAAGADYLIAGLLSFLVAAMISLAKAGYFARCGGAPSPDMPAPDAGHEVAGPEAIPAPDQA